VSSVAATIFTGLLYTQPLLFLVKRHDVRKISNVGRFVRVNVHKPNGFQMERADGKREEFQFDRMTRRR
jgi:hypothetical protein